MLGKDHLAGILGFTAIVFACAFCCLPVLPLLAAAAGAIALAGGGWLMGSPVVGIAAGLLGLLAAILVWRRWTRRRRVLGRAAASDQTQPGPYCAVTPIRQADPSRSTTSIGS
jgi:hypothetical protein